MAQKPRSRAKNRTPGASRKAPAKKGQFSIGLLFGLVIVLLILVIFLFNKETINSLVQSRLPDSAEPGNPEKETSLQVKSEPLPEDETPLEIILEDSPSSPEEPLPRQEDPEAENSFVVEESESEAGPPEVENTPPQRSRKARLFFIQVNDQGYIQLKSVIRSVQYTEAPLTSTLQTLFQGPDTPEMNKGLISLIPENTRILSASINQGILTLNLNESFRFNPMGIDGYSAQIQQLVYTATEFETIDKVQILIEGKAAEYLGAEGIYIGKPLSREDLLN